MPAHPGMDSRYDLVHEHEAMMHHPVVNVSHADALGFCAWAGLQLPTAEEWRWAALGAPMRCESCCGDRLSQGFCSRCNDTSMSLRRYPWGDEPPSPERCVWAGHPDYGPQLRASENADGITAPVVVKTCGRLVPARPMGVSWCKAHDMAGNVYEMTDDRLAHGGSFRTDLRARRERKKT